MALRSTTNPVIRLLRLQLICDRPKALSSACVGSLSAMVSNIDWIAFVKPYTPRQILPLRALPKILWQWP
jgi:hypothetical protein